VQYGELTIRSIAVSILDSRDSVVVIHNGRRILCKRVKDVIDFGAPLSLSAGMVLRMKGKTDGRTKECRRCGIPRA
jgi:hypothetical protein